MAGKNVIELTTGRRAGRTLLIKRLEAAAGL